VHSFLAADLVDLHDVGLHQRGGGPSFVLEAADELLVAGQAVLKHFESDLPPQRALLGQVHVGHAAASQTPQDLVVSQPLSRKVGFGRGVGGDDVGIGHAEQVACASWSWHREKMQLTAPLSSP
jgi:hypothetical protein